MPRADNLPRMMVATHSTPCTHTPMGVKGCGEVGTIGSPAAVANAVVDALSHLGVNHVDMPASANRVWRHHQKRVATASGRIGRTAMKAFDYHKPNSVSEAAALCRKRIGQPPPRRRHVAASDHEAAARGAERRDRSLGHCRRSKASSAGAGTITIGAMTRHVDVASSPTVANLDPGAGAARRRHRRPGCAQSRNDRRFARQQRSGRRLPGRGSRTRRHVVTNTREIAGRPVLPRHVRDGAGAGRIDHGGEISPPDRRAATRKCRTRRRVSRWSAFLSPSSPTACGSL